MRTLVIINSGTHTGRAAYIYGDFPSRELREIRKALVHWFNGEPPIIMLLTRLAEKPMQLFDELGPECKHV